MRSPDTDVFMLLIKYAPKISLQLFMDTGVGNQRRIISITSVIEAHGSDLCNALLSLHAFTGCDTVSAFVRKGKVTPLNMLIKNSQYLKVFDSIGVQSNLTQDQYDEIEAFTCLLYGTKSGVTDINKLRYTMFMTRYSPSTKLLSLDSGIDLSLLPPCRSSLKMHIARTNYQALIWNQADIPCPDLPEPEDGNGWVLQGETLDYQWTESDMLPAELSNLVLEQDDEEEESEDEYYNVQDDMTDDEEIDED